MENQKSNYCNFSSISGVDKKSTFPFIIKFHRMKYLCFINIISAVWLCFGCSTPQRQSMYQWDDMTEKVCFSIIPADSTLIRTGGMEIMGNRFLFYNISQPDIFSLYQLRNDSLIFVSQVQKRGRGPYEALSSRAVFMPQCTTVFLIDQQTRQKAYKIPLTDTVNLQDISKWQTLTLPATQPLMSILPTGCDGTFIAQILNDRRHMFGVFKDNDSTITPLEISYPETGIECPEISLGTAFLGTLQKRPEHNEYVFSAQNSRYVMIFSLKDTIPKNIKLLYDAVPQFTVTTDGINVKMSSDALSGFYVQGTRDYIYLTPRNHRKKDMEALEGQPSFGTAYETFVFDWNGKPVKRILTDKPVKSVTVDNMDTYLYAKHTDSTTFEDRIVRGKLHL